MFYIICNILYVIGMIVAAGILIAIIARAFSVAEFEFYTKAKINEANGVYKDNNVYRLT